MKEVKEDDVTIIENPVTNCFLKNEPLDVACFVRGDGHCIARCFSHIFQEDVDQVLTKLKTEFKRNISLYYRAYYELLFYKLESSKIRLKCNEF